MPFGLSVSMITQLLVNSTLFPFFFFFFAKRPPPMADGERKAEPEWKVGGERIVGVDWHSYHSWVSWHLSSVTQAAFGDSLHPHAASLLSKGQLMWQMETEKRMGKWRGCSPWSRRPNSMQSSQKGKDAKPKSRQNIILGFKWPPDFGGNLSTELTRKSWKLTGCKGAVMGIGETDQMLHRTLCKKA